MALSDYISDPTIDSIVVTLSSGYTIPAVTKTLTIKGDSLEQLRVTVLIDSSRDGLKHDSLPEGDAAKFTDAVNRIFVSHSVPDILPWNQYSFITDLPSLYVEKKRKGMSVLYQYYLGYRDIEYSPELKHIIECARTLKWPEKATAGMEPEGMRQQPDSIEINFSTGGDETTAQLHTWVVYKNGQVSYREEIPTKHDADSPEVAYKLYYRYTPCTNAAKIQSLVTDLFITAHGIITQESGEKLCTEHPDNIGITIGYGPRNIFYAYNLGKKDLRYHPKFNHLMQLLQANMGQ